MEQHARDLARTGDVPYTRSRRLPAVRGILAVDAKDFTGRPAIEHETISRAIPEVLRISLLRAGLAEVWDGRLFPASTGDGYAFGFEPSLMPLVLSPWLDTLQDTLSEYNVHSLGTAPLRLRASLHLGPLPETGDGFGGQGTARNDTHRLLDSVPVKAVLSSTSENVTHVAAILSDRCHQDCVASGYTALHPDRFIEVSASVPGKDFSQRAWIHVPVISGPLRDHGVLGPQAQAPAAPEPQDTPPAAPAGTNTTYNADGSNINTGTVHGGQSVSNQHVAGDHVGGNKARTVRGFQGDRVRGDKHQGRA
ncbi:hypothetical protein ACN20G_01035 [Streptomyces sp. BI20]|uniref:hypothetical protein n=1 Tax=Streptomyces sp. BI20 TaxID=3403460 RepID=UPI003C74999B